MKHEITSDDAVDALVEALAAIREGEAMMTASKTCHLDGGRIGPDVTGRPMCYGCGPVNMLPLDVPEREVRMRRVVENPRDAHWAEGLFR